MNLFWKFDENKAESIFVIELTDLHIDFQLAIMDDEMFLPSTTEFGYWFAEEWWEKGLSHYMSAL